MNYARIIKHDVTNGKGIRTTIFFSGCTLNCKGCFNKEVQNFNYGNEFTKEVEDRAIEYMKDEQVVGVSLLGGEVFQQEPRRMIEFVKRIKQEVGKPIWIWSGYVYEQIIKLPHGYAILENTDVLIDGRFEEDKKDLSLMYRGSSNQRVIDVQKTLTSTKIEKIDI